MLARTIPALPSLMTGALLAGIFVSMMLLPFVAEGSDFRVFRRVAGADDAAVTRSYGYAQRYQVYIQLNDQYPHSEFIVAAEGAEFHVLLHLLAFAAAGPSCTANGATRSFIAEGRADDHLLDVTESMFRWDGGDARGDRTDRIQANGRSDRFLVIASNGTIDVIGINLLKSDLAQRCVENG